MATRVCEVCNEGVDGWVPKVGKESPGQRRGRWGSAVVKKTKNVEAY